MPLLTAAFYRQSGFREFARTAATFDAPRAPEEDTSWNPQMMSWTPGRCLLVPDSWGPVANTPRTSVCVNVLQSIRDNVASHVTSASRIGNHEGLYDG